jgi:hypothetical protein
MTQYCKVAACPRQSAPRSQIGGPPPPRRGTTPKRLWCEPGRFDFHFRPHPIGLARLVCTATSNGSVPIPSHPVIKTVKATRAAGRDSPQKPPKQRAAVSSRLGACRLIGGEGVGALHIVATAQLREKACMSCYIAISPAQFNGCGFKFRRGHALLFQSTTINSPEHGEAGR